MRLAAVILLLFGFCSGGRDSTFRDARIYGMWNGARLADECGSVDRDALLAAWKRQTEEAAEFGYQSQSLDGLRIAIRPLGYAGLYHPADDAIELDCGREAVLRHELHHRACYRDRRPCDCGKVAYFRFATADTEQRREYNRLHPLKINCEGWSP